MDHGLGASGKGEQKSSKTHLVNCAVALEKKVPQPSPIKLPSCSNIFLIEDTAKLTMAS